MQQACEKKTQKLAPIKFTPIRDPNSLVRCSYKENTKWSTKDFTLKEHEPIL